MKMSLVLSFMILSFSAWADPSEKLRNEFKSQGQKNGFGSAGLIIYRIGSSNPLFEFTYNDFKFDQQIAVASSAKWITAATIMTLVRDGKLKLNDTTSDILGPHWKETKGKITLAQLLSFTSGLDQSVTCIMIPFISVDSCSRTIAKNKAQAAAGELFHYGNAHMVVAARMAEVVTGKDYNTLFQDQLAVPMGFAKGTKFYTLPRKRMGANPWPAGGLVISTNDYIKFLMMIASYGHFNGKQILPEDLVREMEKDKIKPGMKSICEPLNDNGKCMHYGLGHWLEEGEIYSAGGMMGFVPWIDRKHQYLAIFATEDGLTSGQKAFDLVKQLRPHILSLLSP